MSKEEEIEKHIEKRLRNTTRKEELQIPDYTIQAKPKTIFVSYTYNYSFKPSTIVTSFLKSGQFFLPRFTNLLFGLAGPEPNPVLGSKPKLVLTYIIHFFFIQHFRNFRVFSIFQTYWRYFRNFGGFGRYFGHFRCFGDILVNLEVLSIF